MSPLRLVGHILLWIGFFAGAFIAVRNAEVAGDKWSTIEWPYYALALTIGTFGVVVLRLTRFQAATHADKLEADIHKLEVTVRALLARLKELRAAEEQTDVFEVHRLIDAQLVERLGDFVDARQTLIHSYGLQAYAAIMTDFSIAERNINRAWSASADGYIDEVWLSLARAEDLLRRVAAGLDSHKKGQLGL